MNSLNRAESVEKDTLRKLVFFPALLILVVFILCYFIDPKITITNLLMTHKYLISKMSGIITLTSITCFMIGIFIVFLPVSNIKIGGKCAKPIVNRWQWFNISFCTTIATGILYWASAEPFLHRNTLLNSKNISENIVNSKVISILWHHWSGIAYTIFLIPTILIAYLIYNKNYPARMSTVFIPILGKAYSKKCTTLIDCFCIFSMIAGITSSLATGLIMMSGSIEGLVGSHLNSDQLGGLCSVIVLVFVSSSISGMMRGIKWLSFVNIILILSIGLFFLFHTNFDHFKSLIFRSSLEYGRFVGHIFIQGIKMNHDQWAKDWTIFYWSAWIGWAPLTSFFLAKLTYGYRIKEIVLFNFLIPTVLTMMWLFLISTTAFELNDLHQNHLGNLIINSGPEVILSELLSMLPFATTTKIIVLGSAFVSFVTSADSNLSVMAELSINKGQRESKKLSVFIKFLLGTVIGLISWIMVSWLGIDGLRILNNLAAFPALLIIICMVLSALKIFVVDQKKSLL